MNETHVDAILSAEYMCGKLWVLPNMFVYGLQYLIASATFKIRHGETTHKPWYND